MSTHTEGDALDVKARGQSKSGLEREPIQAETFLEKQRDTLIGVLSVGLFLGAWEFVASNEIVNPLFISSPTRIIRAFGRLVESGVLANDIAVSSQEFVIGYGLALVIGVPIGMVIGWYRIASAVFAPFMVSLYATPKIALMPLMIVWLGIGLWSKVAVVFLASVFPYFINMQTAMRTLDADQLKAARSFGASEFGIFRTIGLPTAVPFLISGMRLALGHGLIAIVVGELYAANAGIGYRIIISGSSFRTDDIFVGVMVLIAASLSLNALFLSLERKFSVWRPAQH